MAVHMSCPGLSSAPRLFAKLSKPVWSHLRIKGHVNSAFIDDSFLGDCLSACRKNVMDSIHVVRSSGFVIHPMKPVFDPVQILPCLGFVLNSIAMTVTISPERASKLHEAACLIRDSELVAIQLITELVGRLVSSFPGVELGPLLHGLLDNEKSAALKTSHGNFDATMTVSQNAKSDIEWWSDNIEHTANTIQRGKPCLVLYSGASNLG